MAEAIRVWLEPGYDQGRTGAWLLDWPGAFTYGSARETAIGRAVPAAHRFVEWARSHGEQIPPAPAASAEVMDEVAATTLEDGYVVNATFGPDEREVDEAEIDAHLRRLARARSDLLTLVERIRAWESDGRAIADDGRSVDAVLRHLAGAETWFVSRLDADARYRGPRDDVEEYLEASRAFLEEGLRRLVRERVTARNDSKGERWTLAKVVRRSLYHSLDHLDERDRRMALAENRVDRVQLSYDATIDLAELRHLFASAGLVRRSRDSDEVMAQVLAGSTVILSAWDGTALVGFARLLSDEATNAYVSTVAVAPRWQDRGLGTRMMRELLKGREHMKLVLEAAAGAESFYQRIGFQRASTVLVRPRGVS
jgi:ribosomal protein S18 acetylase RimI-like enzyme